MYGSSSVCLSAYVRDKHGSLHFIYCLLEHVYELVMMSSGIETFPTKPLKERGRVYASCHNYLCTAFTCPAAMESLHTCRNLSSSHLAHSIQMIGGVQIACFPHHTGAKLDEY